jgi:electron transfer flavoprotein alpha subunit
MDLNATMETILFLAHTEADGSLGRAALESLGAARELAAALPDSRLIAGLVGADVRAAADGIASCGAARFLGVSGAPFAQPRYSTDVEAVTVIGRASGATVVVAPATSRWNRALAGAAYRLGGRIDSHATAISAADGSPAVTRWYYRQRLEAVVCRKVRPWFILLDPGCAQPWTGSSGTAAIESIDVAPAPAPRTTVVGVRSPSADLQTIRPDAKLLFVAGAGWTKAQPDGKAHGKEAEELILDFLRKTKASLGSTKSLVDLSGEGQAVLGFMTHMNQVGQTGSTPRHSKGLATCCHGEEPHTVGWRFVNERRAVNLNPNCGWAQGKADVLYVADAFAVMREVDALLGAKPAS